MITPALVVEEKLVSFGRVPTTAEVRELLTAAVTHDHGRSAFEGTLLHSVSQHCVQHAASPVIVVQLGKS